MVDVEMSIDVNYKKPLDNGKKGKEDLPADRRKERDAVHGRVE
jgi:hypothetical protein